MAGERLEHALKRYRKLSRIECMQRKPVRQPVSESEPASIHSAPLGAMNGTLEAPHEAHSG